MVIVIGPFVTSNPENYLKAGAVIVKGEPEMYFHNFKKKINDLSQLPEIIENFPSIEITMHSRSKHNSNCIKLVNKNQIWLYVSSIKNELLFWKKNIGSLSIKKNMIKINSLIKKNTFI